MKDIVFIWASIVIFGSLLALAGYVNITLPFEGALFLLGSSIAGYTGVKTIGVTIKALNMPEGQGLHEDTKHKLKQILVALYILIIEAFVVQLINKDLVLPLNELLIMSGVCTGVILGGNQAMKAGHRHKGKGNEE